MLKDLANRIKLLFGTGIPTRVETKFIQILMATGVKNDKIKRIHNYGFMSRPLTDKSKAYTLFLGGDVSRGIAFCVEDERYEMELQPGEVAILDNKGNLVHLTASGITIYSDNDVNVSCSNATVNATKTTINSETEINGKTTINGETTLNGAVTNTGGITIDGSNYGTHKHNENDGGTTSTPV
ncbi:phage baseplate assembly protein V [Thiomicrorhabdus sp.]|uniref:phage baseplate assembly protein V n=1 Tax=Thiomicrorhabdus sp. TaxID=2039724 RepID=UPI003562521F